MHLRFGVLITGFAISFGSTFWFDILKRLVGLRRVGERRTSTRLIRNTRGRIRELDRNSPKNRGSTRDRTVRLTPRSANAHGMSRMREVGRPIQGRARIQYMSKSRPQVRLGP